jgi:phosphoribosylanthranilate isomerase
VAEIKFCGMMRAEDADFAASLDAEYVGVIFAGGPRVLTVQQAMEVLAPVSRYRRVGVFGDQTVDEVVRAADWAQLGVVQLHGDSSPRRIEEIRRDFEGEIWKVQRVAGAGQLNVDQTGLTERDAVLVDAYVAGALGGTGITLPWDEIAPEFHALQRSRRRIVLAGGLNPDNVARAIRTLAPYGVDVSSGIESSPGIKDHQKMQAFSNAVRALDT